MKILLGLIILHFLVIWGSKFTKNEKIPYMLTAAISAIMVVYVFFMMGTIEVPEQ